MLVEPDDQVRRHETGRHITAHDLRGLPRELWQERRRPQPVAEQGGNQATLRVVLMMGDIRPREHLAVKVATQHEGTIVRDHAPVEAGEGVLGLEVPDLQDAIGLGVEAGAAGGERQFGLGQRRSSDVGGSPTSVQTRRRLETTIECWRSTSPMHILIKLRGIAVGHACQVVCN